MPDDQDTKGAPQPPVPGLPPAEQTPPAAAPQTPPQVRTFTQEEVGRLLSAERERIREVSENKAREEYERKQNAKPKSPDEQLHEKLSQVDQQLQRLSLATFKVEHGISDEAMESLAPILATQPQEKWPEMVTKLRSAFGASSTPTQPEGANARTPNPPVVPASDRGGPSPTPDVIRAGDPRSWTPEHVERMLDGHKSWAEGVQAVREQFYNGIRNLKIEYPRGK